MRGETYDKLLKLVANADEVELAGIVEVILQRRRTLTAARAAEVFAQIQPGSRVRLKGLKPKYLNGTHGTVLEVQSKNRIKVELINPDRRGVGRFGHTPWVASSCLDVLG